MNNEQGREWFGIGLDDSQLDKAVKDVEKKFSSIASSAEKEGEKVDKAFNKATTSISNSAEATRSELAETISFQKKIISELERQLGPLEAEFRRLNMATSDPRVMEARQKASQAFKDVKQELEGEKAALLELESQVKQNDAAHVSFRTQLRNAREELIRMEQAGLRGTEAYRKLQEETGRLKDSMDDAQQQANILANDQRGFQGVISAVSGLAGAMSAAQGVVGLLAGENENLQRIMLKVQSLMAITIGLQQVANTLNKDSAFRLVTVVKAKELWAAANLKVATTLGITNVQAQIFTATLTLGLSVAITAVVAGLSVLISRSREAAKEQKELNKSISDAAGKSIADYLLLQKAYEKLADTVEAKKKFIEDNKKVFDSLGVSVNSVTDADNLFINNTDSFKTALLERAKAAASFDLAVEKFKEAFNKELQAKNTPPKKNDIYTPEGVITTYNNKESEKLTSESVSAFQKAEDLIMRSINHTAKAEEELKKSGLNGAKTIIEGTKDYWESQRQAALTTLDSLKDVDKGSKAWNEAVQKYTNATNKLKLWDFGQKGEDGSQQQLLEKMSSAQLALEQSRLDVMRQGRDKELEEIRISTTKKLQEIDKQEAELKEAYKKAKKSISQAEIDGFAERRTNALKSGQQQTDQVNIKYFEELKQKQASLSEVFLSEEERKQKAIKDRYDAERKWANELFGSNGMTMDQYNAFINLIDSAETEAALAEFKNKYKTSADKITDIERQAAQDRKKATTDAQKELIDEWEKNQKSKIASDDLMKDGSFMTLFGNLDRLGTGKISGALSKAKAKLKEAQESGELTPTDLKTLIDTIEKGEAEVRERNPFKALAEAVKEYKETKDGSDLKDIAFAAAESFKIIEGSLSAVVDGLKQMGLAGDEETQKLLGEMVKLAGSASELAMGIATGNPIQIIQGAIGVLTSLFEIFDKRSRDANRRIKEHADQVKALQNQYKALEQAIKNAFGTDYYQKQIEQAANLEKQIKQLYGMIAAEESKKQRKQDADKIQGWKDEIEDLKNQAADIRKAVIDELMTTDLRSFSSQLASSVIQGYAEGMKDLESVVQGSVDDLMRSMIAKQFDILVAQNMLKPLFQAMERSINVDAGDFTFSDEDLKAIKAAGQSAKNSLLDAGEGFRKILQDLGLDTLGDQQRKGISKGIAQASQESVDAFGGTATTISGHTFSIVNDFKVLINVSNSMLKHLANIDTNTARLQNIEKGIDSVKSDINDITVKGIKIQ